MSFDFTTLVTDRTQSDVQRVRSVAAKIINGTASAAETAEWNAANMKGAYNYTDLNRVTAAIEALKAMLEGYGYTVSGYKRIEIPHSDGARLPEGHTELAWIESTGTQAIDTGFKPNNNTRVRMDASLTATTGNDVLFGARSSATVANYAVMKPSAGVLRSDYNNAYTQTWDVDVAIRRIIDKNKETTTIDGVSKSYTNANFQTPANLTLFALNNNGSVQWNSTAKLYACQIYDNGTLIRDYVPDLSDDGQVGMYDLVEGTFYPNAGTGTFIAGPAVVVEEKDPYLWYETDIPAPDLMAAYLANVSAIRSVLDMLPATPAVPADMEQLTTDKANAIERILADINTLIQNMIAAWFYSGEIYSGEV